MDVTQAGSNQACLGREEQLGGPVNILLNVGYVDDGPLLGVEPDAFDDLWCKCRAPYGSAGGFRQLVRRTGRILINIASLITSR